MASLPGLASLTPTLARAYDAVLVGCSVATLESRAFRGQVRDLSRVARLVAIMARPSADAGVRAARLGFHGLVAREVSPRAIERTVAAVIEGQRAFPRDVVRELVQQLGVTPETA